MNVQINGTTIRHKQKYDFKKSHVVETHSCYRLHLNSTFSEFKQIKLSFSVLGCTKQQQTD